MYADRSREPSPLILITSAPGDPRAARLADDLYHMGLQVKLTDSPAVAERYALDALCVAVLRPGQWNAPAIAATVRAAPAFLLPVLAEAMPLPSGPWTNAPVPMQSPRQVAGEVADAVEEYLRSSRTRSRPRGRDDSYGGRGAYPEMAPRSRPRDGYGDPYGPNTGRSMSAPGSRSGVMAAPRLQPKKSSPVGRVFGSIFSFLLIVAIVGGAKLYGKQLYDKYLGHGATTPQVNYTAAVPGPGCDKGDATWSKVDQGEAVTCQPDGMLISQTGDFSKLTEVSFLPHATTISQAFTVSVTATVKSGDVSTFAGIEVHTQAPKGGQGFYARADSEWKVERYSATDGTDPTQLAVGFLPQATKTLNLQVQVAGPVMTYSINGNAVATVTDTTYTSSADVELFMSEASGKGTASVSFSQFAYSTQADPKLTTDQVAATVTAQAQANAKPYTATVPGAVCDQGGAVWEPASVINEFGTNTGLKCLATGLQITQTAQNRATPIPGGEAFYWLNGAFPANYKISAKVTLASSKTCVGMLTHSTTTQDYFFLVCGDGSWGIILDNGSNSTPLKTGMMTPKSTFTMQVTSNGAAEQLAINGVTIGSANDSTVTTTDELDLVVGGAAQNTSTSAIFSNFTFTPLP